MQPENIKKYDFKTLLVIIIFSFLICNFIFNFGYFYNTDYRLMSLLTLRDYYEGTAPYFVIIIMIFSCLYFGCFCHHVISDIKSATRKFDCIKDLVLITPQFLLALLLVKFVNFLQKINPEDTESNNEIEKLNKKIENLTKAYNDCYDSLSNIDFYDVLNLIFLSFGIFILYILFYNFSHIKFAIYLCLYFILILAVKFLTEHNKIIIIFMLIAAFVSFISGNALYLQERNNPAITCTVINNKTFNVTRIISRGIIVSTPIGLTFYPWNNIKSIHHQQKYKYNNLKLLRPGL